MMLEARALKAYYGESEALHGLDFSLGEGGILALLGANGAGKTTTLRAISGMVRAQGSLTYEGKSLLGRPSEEVARLGVAHVPEGRGTFLRFSVEENLHLGAITRRDRTRVARDLDQVYAQFPQLYSRRRQKAGTLSGGEQQMLAIGRALMLEPRLMLLDEPSFGLAPRIVEDLFARLKELNRELGVALLVVEQNADLALQLAESACVLETGRVVLSGRARTIAADETVRRSYLGY